MTKHVLVCKFGPISHILWNTNKTEIFVNRNCTYLPNPTMLSRMITH